MKDKTSVTSSLSNKDTLTDAQINAGFGFNTILESPDLNGQLYDIDSQVNILTKELCNFLTANGVTINANDNTQISTLLTSLFGAKQDTLVAGNNITIDENNVISAEGSAPANIPLFFNTRFPIAPNNVSWVNSANYSWLYGSTYVDAYKLLTDQFTPVGKFTEGDSYYICTFSDGEIITTTVPVNSGDLAQLETWCSSQGYTYSGATIEEFECYKTVSTSSETIGGTTITFYRTRNKMKIVDTTQEGYLDTIFNSTGVAEYFLIDTVNERFKLPRNKWGYYGTGTGELGDYISESLPEITSAFGIRYGGDAGSRMHTEYSRGTSGDSITTTTTQNQNVVLTTRASLSSPTYQEGAPVQPRGSKGDLYFYVGAAGADVVAEIAGIKAETINNKADIDAQNFNATGKSYLAGIGMPSATYENLTLGTSGASYTAPANGYYFIDKRSSAAAQYVLVDVGGKLNQGAFTAYTSGIECWIMQPVLKGDVIHIAYTAGGTTEAFRFFYAKGDV